MDQLLRIARSGTPDTGTLFRGRAYGESGVREFLIDIISLANASVEGNRYIVVGLDFDDKGRKQKHAIDRADFTGNPSYQTLANEYIEPAIRVRYKPISFDGTRIGVFEIGDCQDRPYMMRIDHSQSLRRGDAYMRVNNSAIKMGRRHLMELFEKKFRDSVSAGDLAIGFPGEIIHKQISLPTCDLSQMPSALASKKLEEMLRICKEAGSTGTPTIVARLTHARLYGAQEPFIEVSPEEIADYPAVALQDDSVKIMTKIGDIPPGEPSEIFKAPLLTCFGSALKGRRFGARYRLDAQNLRRPATGRLKIQFA
jgi:hypothetical protein